MTIEKKVSYEYRVAISVAVLTALTIVGVFGSILLGSTAQELPPPSEPYLASVASSLIAGACWGIPVLLILAINRGVDPYPAVSFLFCSFLAAFGASEFMSLPLMAPYWELRIFVKIVAATDASLTLLALIYGYMQPNSVMDAMAALARKQPQHRDANILRAEQLLADLRANYANRRELRGGQ